MSELVKTEQELVFQELSEKITNALSIEVNNIENSLVIANAITFLHEKLTPEVMKPIMMLQGSKLGFKTDRDLVKNNTTGKYEKGNGYPLEVVKNCFMEMSLIGLLPTGNQWNIIGGNSYVTQEGGYYLLKKRCPTLKSYTLSYPDVQQSADKKTASVKAIIKWETIKGEKEEETIDFPVKSDAYTTFDALIGKADRKAKMWLVNKINGTDIKDGDVNEIPYIDLTPKPTVSEVSKSKEYDRVKAHIDHKSTISMAVLEKCKPAITESDHDLKEMYVLKVIELATTEEELKSVMNWVDPEIDFDIYTSWDDKRRELIVKVKK